MLAIMVLVMLWGVKLVLPAVVWLFWLGCRTLKQATMQSGTYALTLYVIGVVLCEPLVNLWVIYSRINADWSVLPDDRFLDSVRFSATMAVVLLPGIGLFVRECAYRRALLQLFGLGLLRWLLVIGMLAGTKEPWMLGSLLLLLIGLGLATIMLWITIIWGHRTLNDALAVPDGTSVPVGG